MKTRHIFRFFLSILILTGLLWQSGIVQGQPPRQLTSVQVGLFPEYDRPAVLVILDIELSDGASPPQTLSFQVPIDAESLNVTRQTTDGERTTLSYEISETGEWKDVQFATDARSIRIEYYDLNLIQEEDRRSYQYQWLSDYPTESLTLTVRQPFGAGEIHADPPLSGGETGPDDATYFSRKEGAIPEGERFTLDVMYIKDTSNLAYPALEVEPAEPVNDATPGRTPSPLSVIMWLLTVAVAVMLLVGLYYYWFKTNVMDKRERTVQGVGIMNPEKQAVFCHECGMRSRAGDSYCSNCGTELRRQLQNTLRTGS